jgi:hypothetical protein
MARGWTVRSAGDTSRRDFAGGSLLAALVGLANSQSVQAADAGGTEAVTSALNELDAWLGDGDNADRWRAFLHADQLRAEVAKGDEADPAPVAYTLGVLHGDADGLKLAPFKAAADAINAWLLDLREKYENDLPKLAWASRRDHTPISGKQFEEIRVDLRTKAQALGAALAPIPRTLRLKTYSIGLAVADPPAQPTPSRSPARQVLARFRTNQPGLNARFTAAASDRQVPRAANWAGTARAPRPVYERYPADVQRLLNDI